MKNKFLCIGLSLFLGVALLSACDSNPVNDLNLSNNETGESYVDVLTNQSKTPHGKYNEGVLSATEYVATGDGTENQTYTLSYSPALIKGITLDDGEVFGELRVFVNGLEAIYLTNA